MTNQHTLYPPLLPRHKLIFASTAALAVGLTILVSLARLELIYWWLVNCEKASQTCTSVELAFTWWWAPLIAAVLGIAYAAHRLTSDRLEPR
jgi:hypothetical protein